jgi:hypothetical protein
MCWYWVVLQRLVGHKTTRSKWKKIFSRLDAGLISDDKQKRVEAFWLQKSEKLEAQLITSGVGGQFTRFK